MLQPHFLEDSLEIDFFPSNFQLLNLTESDEFKEMKKSIFYQTLLKV